MDIEAFFEEDFIVEDAEAGGVVENVFRNLIQHVPDIVNDFDLPAYFLEEDIEDIEINEHNDIWNDPIYLISDDEDSSDDEISSDSAYSEDDIDAVSENSEDSLISWDGEDSVVSFLDQGFDGWLSSEDEEEMESAALGYAIHYDLINQRDDIWEEFILSTRSNLLLGNYNNEWYWFYRQQIEDRLFDIRRGFSIEEWPEQHQHYD